MNPPIFSGHRHTQTFKRNIASLKKQQTQLIDFPAHTKDMHEGVYYDPDITFNFNRWQAFDPSIIKPNDRVIICEDSSHTYENTIQVLRKFAPYVSPNSYFLVEDGESGYSRLEFHGGAIRAIEEFMAKTNDFELDRRWEFLYGNSISECLKGYLRRKAK